MDTTGTARQPLGTSIAPSASLRERITLLSSPLALWKNGRVRNCAAATLALFTLSACGNIEPWVKPYERQALADPIMALDPNPVSSAYIDHVYEAREGARGALGSSGGGCGCN